MEFKAPYLMAMREQAPKMMRELVRSGKMDEHLTMKSTEAHKMFQELTEHLPKLPNGVVKDPAAASAAERHVLETLIDFPSLRAGPES